MLCLNCCSLSYLPLCRYGLPVNFQVMLLLPHKKMQRRLREELDRLYEHLDNTAFSGPEVSSFSCSFSNTWLQSYKTFFLLHSVEHEFFLQINLKLLAIAISFLKNIADNEYFSANKYENANYCWHFHIYY